ncbi:hypothetical protein [Salsipaludibacter albus]|uniref:hypothetical protein n=1 Tax=Salsipaludibacter albus TaxID=2849650 RepID=UPI001EE4CC77|nr:hypothetical protein [Salsipaludibacter albus]MBY5164306.1 hypothetical protein [Salsipaludibacter albus]
MTMLRPRHAILAATVILLAACGGGDDGATTTETSSVAETTAPPTMAETTAPPTTPPATETTDAETAASSGGGDLVSQMSAAILASQSAAGVEDTGMDIAYTEQEADCIAQEIVDGVGEDALREYGVVTADGRVVEVMEDVVYSEADAGVIADGILGCSDLAETMRASMAEQIGAGDDAMGQCMQDAIDDDVLRDMLSGSLQGSDGQEAMGPLMMAALGCMGDGMTDLPTELPTGLLDELPTDG